jgi:hypothetical protein
MVHHALDTPFSPVSIGRSLSYQTEIRFQQNKPLEIDAEFFRSILDCNVIHST